MSNPNIKPRYKKGSKEAIEDGKKSRRGVSLKAEMKRQIRDNEGLKETLIGEWLKQAMKGHPAFAKLIIEYVDGKPLQTIQNVTDIDKNPIFQQLKKIADSDE